MPRPGPATIDFNAYLVRPGQRESTFVARVRGWEMIGTGIHDGDDVVVDESLEPEDGQVVAAMLSGELVVRRIRLRNGEVTLSADNPHYAPRVVRASDGFALLGVVTRVLHVPL